MDRFEFSRILKKSRPVCRGFFIQEKCRGKRVLDLGCIRHSADFAIQDRNWLHNKIRSVAAETVGVDILAQEVNRLNENGYDIVFADVTKPLNINGQFDVIVAGDLIEHLVNFEGFFLNCRRLLKKEGILIISTPNPFYAELYGFLVFKRRFLINPEHTCWIDPQALLQLAARFGYIIDEIHYLKNSFRIKHLILENKSHCYDILKDKWHRDSTGKKALRKIIGVVFEAFYLFFKLISNGNSALVKYSDYLAVIKLDRAA